MSPAGAFATYRFGEAEIENFNCALRRNLNVGGFQIAVDDAFFVRVLQRLGDLPGDRERVIGV